jgi:hypothetical protein
LLLPQGIEVFAACCDVVTFGSALALALTPLSSVSYSELVGKIMVASQVRSSRGFAALPCVGMQMRLCIVSLLAL